MRTSPPGRTVLIVLLLCLAGSAAGHAADYWACVDGQWTAVGRPSYPKPIKTCGSHPHIPRTQTACVEVGATWGRAGLFPRPQCKMPTRDGGHTCADSDECEGLYLAQLTRALRDQIRHGQKPNVMRTCTRYVPVYGCIAIVSRGEVARVICRD